MSGGDVLGGAASGAAAGVQVGGAVGAVIGGVLGAIGGIFSSKAKKKKKQAAKEQQRAAERDAAVQRRDILRQYRATRAQSVAAAAAEGGGLQSSAAQGAIGSLASQNEFNLNFFDTQIASNKKVNTLLGKAEKYAGYASLTNSAISAGAGLYQGLGGQPMNFRDFRNPSPTIQTPSTGYSTAPGIGGRF